MKPVKQMRCAVCMWPSNSKFCEVCTPSQEMFAKLKKSEREIEKLCGRQKTIRHHVLNEHGQPIPATFAQWAVCFQSRSRVVEKTKIGRAEISTVFLGLDHGWDRSKPTLWQTMVFGGKLDQEQNRCGGNREQAEAMHEAMVARVKNSQRKKTK